MVDVGLSYLIPSSRLCEFLTTKGLKYEKIGNN